MPIPKFDDLFFPLMQLAQDGKEHLFKEVIEHVENYFHLTEAEKERLLPSGSQRVISNRVGWARTFLKKAGLIKPRRGVLQITQRGVDFLSKKPKELTVKDLRAYPDFEKNWHPDAELKKEIVKSEELTPEERIEEAFEEIEKDLAKSLLEQIAIFTPRFFERLVIDLLLKMGYGGSFKDAGRAIGKSGDGGIDGIIKEDKLGLDTIYIQAKRYQEDSAIGSPNVREFMGALAGHHAKKGVYITTSYFSDEARKYAVSLDTKIVLIDGKQLAELMIEHAVGVSQQSAYIVKRLDSEYFSEE